MGYVEISCFIKRVCLVLCILFLIVGVVVISNLFVRSIFSIGICLGYIEFRCFIERVSLVWSILFLSVGVVVFSNLFVRRIFIVVLIVRWSFCGV